MTDEPRAERGRGANLYHELLTPLNYLNYERFGINEVFFS